MENAAELVYLVEDDDNIRELVVYTLRSTGFAAEGFARPSEFYAALAGKQPDLLLLDIMLPEEDGLTILGKLRADPETAALPVILLTAKGSEMDKVRGFEMGADDYIAKPFGMMELVARVRARLRGKRPEKTDCYTAGPLSLSPSRVQVTVNGNSVALTKKEFDLLCYLFENRGMVLTRDQLLNRIWGYAFDGESRTVDVHIRTLRRKLGEAGDLIETVRGIGYRIL